MSETLGKWSFWIMFVAFNVTFFPMSILGLLGMPRRIYTYQNGLGWNGLNLIVSIGGFFFALGVFLTFVNLWISRKHPKTAGPNPWDADTLEWATDSPTPEYNFAEVPIVESRHPLWDGPLRYGTGPFGLSGALERAIPTTGGLSAEPEHVLFVPRETALPFWVALGIALVFLAFLVEAVLVAVIGIVLAFIAGLRWVWRIGGEHPDIVEVLDEP
jgi:hypothetical protein